MTITNRLLEPMAKDEQPRDEHGFRFVAVYDSGVRCYYVEPDGSPCKRQADTRGMCKMHYRREMRRLRGLKPPGRFKDLSGQWSGPREDLFVDHRIEGESIRGRAVWWVIHDIQRGGCAGQGPLDSDSLRRGDCPAACRKAARFKAQTMRKAAGRTGRLFPLTPRGSKAISESDRKRNESAGPGGVIGTLPRTSDGHVLKATNRRGGGKGSGRRRMTSTAKREAAAVRAKAYRDRKRGAEPRPYQKTGNFAM